MDETTLFWLGMALHYGYLAVVVWSVVFPARRIWPPTQRGSWVYSLSWSLFGLAVAADVFWMFRHWNTWLPLGPTRYALGVPLVAVGALFLGWGMRTLGLTPTLGRERTLAITGPYRFTRNPQYVGDLLLLAGLMVLANAWYATLGLAVLMLAFVLMPLAEEPWLEEVYGDAYRAYKTHTPRFL